MEYLMLKKGDRNDSILNDIMQLGSFVTGTVITIDTAGKVLEFRRDHGN